MIKRMKSTRLRPLIGVSACLKENGRGGWNHAVGDKYVQAAIRAVGGLPVIVPAFGREFDAHESGGRGMTEALDRLLDTMDAQKTRARVRRRPASASHLRGSRQRCSPKKRRGALPPQSSSPNRRAQLSA